MRSARRKAYIEKKSKGKKNKSFVWKILIPLLILALFFFLLNLNTSVWDGKNKTPFVYVSGENVGVLVLDPKLSEITTFIIPGDTQVRVARNYGSLRIKNVLQLGKNEDLEGSLLAETVTQNFLFPLNLWVEKDPNFYDGNLKNRINFLFFPGRTNIKFGDRLKMTLFAAKVSEPGKSVIDLKESRFLSCGKLNDGQKGCWVDGTISQRLTVYFSDNELEGKDLRVNIIDETGSVGVPERLGEIIEVVGGKVVSIDRRQVNDSDCQVGGTNEQMIKKISRLFSCKVADVNSPFDLDIQIGKKFAERF